MKIEVKIVNLPYVDKKTNEPKTFVALAAVTPCGDIVLTARDRFAYGYLIEQAKQSDKAAE